MCEILKNENTIYKNDLGKCTMNLKNKNIQ